MTFCGSTTVSEFVGCKTCKEGLGVRRVGISFLWDFQVAELAENQFSRADRGAMDSEGFERRVYAIAT
jgi:hypothetical protein